MGEAVHPAHLALTPQEGRLLFVLHALNQALTLTAVPSAASVVKYNTTV